MDSVAPSARPCYVEVLTGRAPERHARTSLGYDFSTCLDRFPFQLTVLRRGRTVDWKAGPPEGESNRRPLTKTQRGVNAMHLGWPKSYSTTRHPVASKSAPWGGE